MQCFRGYNAIMDEIACESKQTRHVMCEAPKICDAPDPGPYVLSEGKVSLPFLWKFESRWNIPYYRENLSNNIFASGREQYFDEGRQTLKTKVCTTITILY